MSTLGVFRADLAASAEAFAKAMDDAAVSMARAAEAMQRTGKAMSLTVYLYERPGIRREVYSGNITHNLTQMADAAGIYEAMWRPDEFVGRHDPAQKVVRAGELIEALRTGLARLKLDPDRYREHDAGNGWGTVDQFIPFVAEYLEACERWPDAEVRVSR